MTTYRAVIFDLFGTLVAPYQRWPELIPGFATLLEIDASSFDLAWTSTAVGRDTGGFRTAELAVEHCVQQLGLAATRDQIARAAALQQHNVRLALTQTRPEMLHVLTLLREQGYRTGLISNCDNETVVLWPETPFLSAFDATVFSCDMGLMKPDPRIYALASERLGVPPSQTVFIDDNEEFVAAAEAVGMRGIICRDSQTAVDELQSICLHLP
ncbi:MAG: HAD family phosphatase [Dehalococcoidia bacterium]